MGNCACLDGPTWRACVCHFAAMAQGAAPVANVLRVAFYLQNLAPPPYSSWARCPVDEAGFESMLAIGDNDSAARAIVGPQLQCDVAIAQGITSAKVWLDGSRATCTAHDPDQARALVKAWIGCALVLLDCAPSLASQPGSSSHRSA